MRSPIDNVMLVEKWNCRVKVFLKYLLGEVFPYLEAFHSICEYVYTFVSSNPFGTTRQIAMVDIEFQRLLNPCNNHCNFSFRNMRSNDYS
jgi:hypothetical protein